VKVGVLVIFLGGKDLSYVITDILS